MKRNLRRIACGGIVVLGLALGACTTAPDPRPAPRVRQEESAIAAAQAPSWSADDLSFFLHGSMGTEVLPERVLRAFVRTYPDLFPTADLSHFGLIPDPSFGWPIGFSRREVAHLGGLSAVGINCASCHVGQIESLAVGTPVRVLGMPSLFDVEAFFGAMTVATFRTADPAAMKRFLAAYLDAGGQTAGDRGRQLLNAGWRRQESALGATIAGDPFGANGIAPGGLHPIAAAELALDERRLATGSDLVPLVRAMLRLFHNMRAALHIPDRLPSAAPPASGPGRNDAFGLLSAALFGAPQPYAPVKFGVVWNLQHRRWVHWDGNTQSPIGRNLLAALGLGAPLLGKEGRLDFAVVKRQTDLSETIHAPRYPFAIDREAAGRGAPLYHARCAACHDGPETDARLHALETIGTDPQRARLFTPGQAERFNRLLADVQIAGYQPSAVAGLRGTQRYWAPSLAGVWARAPYLHNGSVRTVAELLAPPTARAPTFARGSRRYDVTQLGFTDGGPYRFDTRTPGNSNAGHDYGTDLSPTQKRELIEFLKTL